MLMALLPLAGWAQGSISLADGYEVKLVGTGAYVYNGEKQPIHVKVQKTTASEELTENTDFTVVFYKDGEVVTEVKNAGTYSVAAKGKGDYKDETPALEFDITPLSIEGEAFEIAHSNDQFNYDGQPKTYTTFDLKWKKGQEDIVTLSKEGATIDYTWEYKSNVNVGQAKLVLTGQGNFQGTKEQAIDIEPGQLPEYSATAYTFTALTTHPIYSATEVTVPANTIKVISGTRELVEGTDFVVAWKDANGDILPAVNNVYPKPVNAGTYTAVVYGKGNYAEGRGVTQEAWTLTVDKRDLQIYVEEKSKVYDGEPIPVENGVITGTKIQFAGLQGADANNAELKGEVKAGFKEGVVNAKTAGDYTMVPTYGVEAIITKNYKINALETAYTIEKRQVTVTAKNQKFTYTGAEQALNTTVIAAGVNVQNATVTIEAAAANSTTGVVGDDDITGMILISLKEGVKIQNKVNAAYTGAIIIGETALEENEVRNYTINGVAGDVEMEGQDLIMIAANVEKEYGYVIKPADFKLVKTANVEWKADPSFKITDAEGNEVNENSGILDKGTYKIELTNAEAICPDNYDYNPEKVYAGELTISKKVLAITVDPVSLNPGDGLDQLKKYIKLNYTTVNNEEIAYEINFAEGILNDDSKLKDAGDYQEGQLNAAVVITFLADDAPNAKDNANYEFPGKDENYVNGHLTAKIELGNAAALVLDPAYEKLDGKIQDAATKGGQFNVTFGSKKMKKQEWYAMVLPFATSAKELVKVLNTYVVVNTLSDKSTDQNFKFTLEMGDIPAGKPFIIKPAEAIDWAGYTEGEGDEAQLKPYKFENKAIVSTITPYGAEGIVTIDGTYKTGEILGVAGEKSESTATLVDRVWWLSDTDYEASKIANDWRKPKNNAHDLKPMEAYLVAEAGWTTYAPIITVEDFDGETTSIKTLNADKINNLQLGEGWYNLNGVKLQGAPTQKGIYINNGKKVIIK